jgi:predicted PurR-regulated permease PerM
MSEGTNNEPTVLQKRAMSLMLIVVSAALAWILLPLYGPIMWGVIIAMLFAPLHAWLQRRVTRRRTPAALMTLIVVVLLVILPLALIAGALAREATHVYELLQAGGLNPTRYLQGVYEALPPWATAWLDRLGLINFDVLQKSLTDVLARGSQFIATQALNVGQVTIEFLVYLLLSLYLAFFLIRDGDVIARTLRDSVPLAPTHRKELVAKFTVALRATLKGDVLVAALQGTLGGLAFWVLGINGALLWGLVMAFLSLLPALGAALVWAPVAAYLFLSGELWQAVALAAWGVVVIGLIDNILRPILVGKDTQLPNYVVLFTTIGGLLVFGINGFILGPSIAAMFVAVWHMVANRPSDPPH